jgi:hypothetical protein
MTNPVDLLCNFAGASDGGKITEDDHLGLRQGTAGIVSAREIASVENHLMTLLDEQLTSHQPQPLGRSRNEYA